MDPFTEKLLERTRARRENLQKKLAERPNAAKVVKRGREPLIENNAVIGQPVAPKAASTKPSPSKRRCSSENVEPAAREQDGGVASALQDHPPSASKPPPVPTGEPAGRKEETRGLESDKMAKLPQSPKRSEEPEEESAAAGMKSRLQRLAEQRKCWDGNNGVASDCTPVSLLRREDDVPVSSSSSSSSSEGPVGRRGRLAHLAATIGSWEDDLSHANLPKDKVPEKSTTVCAAQLSMKDASLSAGAKGSMASHVTTAPANKSSGHATTGLINKSSGHVTTGLINKSSGHVTTAPANKSSGQVTTAPANKSSGQVTTAPASKSSGQVTTAPASKSSGQVTTAPASKSSGQVTTAPASKSSGQVTTAPASKSSGQVTTGLINKSSGHVTTAPASKSSGQVTTAPANKSLVVSNQLSPSFTKSNQGVPPSPQKVDPRPVTSPLKTVPPSSRSVSSSPLKSTPVATASVLACSPQKVCAKANTPKSAAPGVKSFLERFEERCHERTNPCSPAVCASQTATPKSGLGLRSAQSAQTTTADLVQKQKLERESELAQIHSRVQGNNMWKSAESKGLGGKAEEMDACEPKLQPKPHGTEIISPAACGLLEPTPNPTHIPLEEEEVDESSREDEGKEIEMNVDHSAVIDQLFDGLHDDDEDEEEDALNISSMSLLTPLAESVAAVYSPDRSTRTSTPAHSFIVKNKTPDKQSPFQRSNKRKSGSSDSVDALEDDHKLPYSIDAYRSIRVKETGRVPGKDGMVRKEDVSSRAEEVRGGSLFSIKQKIKLLTNEMNLQQTIIHQASQALNCCTDEEHGKGSQVEAEAERLLIVATKKREALKTELQCLKGENPAGQKKNPPPLQPAGISASKGSITLQELRLPLKADFVCAIANKPESVKYSFFIMIGCGAEKTVATPLVSTHRGLSGDTFTFPTKFTMSDVCSDFCIDIDIYYLVQKVEISGDKKKKSSKSKAITPKRFLAITKSSQTPVVASPGGPNAVRSSNFVLVGSHKLTLSSIGKNKFPLEKVPFLCPLEGHVYLKMQCEVGCHVEEKGFLTMFEDVSGFGAWHRRWCVLSGYCISYWTYPDDERRKNPIGRINLVNCSSKKVEAAKREFCARPNTLELTTVRPQREDDKETLVSQCTNTMCVTTNWLSADTKAERNSWMSSINQVLVDLRMWRPDACYAGV
ncbi:anillin isoform X2 [Nerophis ophidion]|uniref:anillin isoform X2 n=1 Tax=Nerophis ophidion TaxID=159077 RepID=UPI002ADFE4BB|nr:anillin isoform X2 [Nerophis ophidion]